MAGLYHAGRILCQKAEARKYVEYGSGENKKGGDSHDKERGIRI